MKRIVAVCVAVAPTLVLLACVGVVAAQKKKTPSPPAVQDLKHIAPSAPAPIPPPPEPQPAREPGSDDAVLQELVAIMNKTDSPCTFTVTVMALEAMGGKAKYTVPGIIRNAERLKIFTTTSRASAVGTAPSLKQEIAASVMEAISNLMSGNTTKQNGPTCNRWVAPPLPPTRFAVPYYAPNVVTPIGPQTSSGYVNPAVPGPAAY